MSKPDSLIARSVDFVYGLRLDAVPAADVRAMTRLLADTLACGIAARDEEQMRALARYAVERSAPGMAVASLFAATGRAALPQAALANTAAVRALDANDLYRGPPAGDTGHFSDAIPALLAAGEAMGATGEELLIALVAAYEIQAMLCDAARWMEGGWHTAGLVAWAVAAPAARLLGRDAEVARTAMSIAGISGQTLQAWLRPDKPVTAMKTLGPGLAASRALEAVELAGLGVSAPEDALETMLRRLGAEPAAMEVERLGRRWTIQRNLIKRYPAQVYTQGAVEAALALYGRGVRAEKIAAVTIRGHRLVCGGVQGSPRAFAPETREDADHSTPFVVAMALLRGHLTPEDYAGEPWWDAEVRALMGRIRLLEDAGWERARRERGVIGCQIEAELADGQLVVAEVAQPRGHPDAPLDDAGLRAKMAEMLAGRLGAGGTERLLAACVGLPGAGSLDEVTRLIAKRL